MVNCLQQANQTKAPIRNDSLTNAAMMSAKQPDILVDEMPDHCSAATKRLYDFDAYSM